MEWSNLLSQIKETKEENKMRWKLMKIGEKELEWMKKHIDHEMVRTHMPMAKGHNDLFVCEQCNKTSWENL